MPVTLSDMKYYYSGGLSNSDPLLSTGGEKSDLEAVLSPTKNNLFDDVTSDELITGVTEYRCIYLANDNATDTLQDVLLWVQANTPSDDTAIAIGWSGVTNDEAEAISPSTSAPAGITFVTAVDEANALDLGDMLAGDFVAIWIRRVVDAGSLPYSSDGFTLRFKGTP